MNYTTIFIDWYITLSHSHYWEHLIKDDKVDYELFSTWLLDHMDYFNEWMRGRYSAKQIADLIAQDAEKDSGYILSELNKSCEMLTFEIPELADEISRLRQKGNRVVLATDNILEFSTITAPAQKLLDCFDDILNSAELGVLKSDLDGGFFDAYIEHHGIDAEKALLIDDSELVETALSDHPITQIRVKDSTETLKLLRSL